MVDAPSATIDGGVSEIVRLAAGPNCVSVADPPTLGPADVSVAVIDDRPGFVVLVTVAVYVPSPLSVVAPTCWPPSVEKMIVFPATGLPSASATAAVAIVADEPLAAMIGGDSETVTVVAGPTANAAGASTSAPSSTDTTPGARPTSRIARITPAAVASLRLLRTVPSAPCPIARNPLILNAPARPAKIVDSSPPTGWATSVIVPTCLR